jgi:hypothetical protein
MAGLSQQRALELLAESIGEIIGTRSEAYRDFMRAVESEEPVDMLLAQSAFDALSPDLRRRIADRVDELVREHKVEEREW